MMSFFSKFRFRLSQKSIDKQLQHGDRILIEFGRAQTPVYVFFYNIPPGAELLADLENLAPLDRRVALPDVTKFMWHNYLDWKETVQETATKYSWGHIFLLAHTTKALRDNIAHRKSLDMLLAKGKSVNYQVDGMFNPSDWNLLHLTTKAGEARDDATRETVHQLFKGCPLLFDFMAREGVPTQEFRDIGLEYDDTYESTLVRSDGPNTSVIWDYRNMHDHPLLSMAAPTSTIDSTVEGFKFQGEARNVPEIEASGTSQHEQVVVSEQQPNSASEIEYVGAQGDVHSDDWEIVSIVSLESDESVSIEEGPLNIHPTEVENSDQEANDMPIQLAEDLADQLVRLVVQEGVTVENTGEHTAINDESGIGWRQEEFLVDQQEDNTIINSSKGILIPQKIVSSRGPTIWSAVTTEAEMKATIANLPGVESSKWASTMMEKHPVSLNADTKAALTDFVNSHTNTANSVVGVHNYYDVIGSAASEAEQKSADTPTKELQRLSSDVPLPVTLPQAFPEAHLEATYSDYIAGFVAMHELPRTAPGSPKKVEADRLKAIRGAEYKNNAAVSESRRKGQKRKVDQDRNLNQNPGADYIPGTGTMDGPPALIDFGGKKANPCSKKKDEPAVPGNRRQGQKRKAQNDNLGAEYARRHHVSSEYSDEQVRRLESKYGAGQARQPERKYAKSALHALRVKLAASAQTSVTNTHSPGLASTNLQQREEPTRQPKGPPASGKEMADDKAKNAEEWPENFAIGAPAPAKNCPLKPVTFTCEKGVHVVE